ARVELEAEVAPRVRHAAGLAGDRLAPGVVASPIGADDLLDGRRVLDAAVGDRAGDLAEPRIADVVGVRGDERVRVQHGRAGAVEAQHAADGLAELLV